MLKDFDHVEENTEPAPQDIAVKEVWSEQFV